MRRTRESKSVPCKLTKRTKLRVAQRSPELGLRSTDFRAPENLIFPTLIKIKFGHILVCCMKNISNMFLAQCWRVEGSSRSFYDFIKMTI